MASSKELNDELKKDSLLRRDLASITRYVAPFLPFMGILSGSVTTGKHIFSHKAKPTSDNDTTQEDGKS